MTDQVEAHILQKYTLVKKVGSGAYGHVWKVTDKKTNEVLALKKIFDAFQHSTDAQRTYRQIVFLHELNHPNIIKLHSVIKADNQKDLYLVFEFMDADLHNAIGQKILKDAHNRYILYQLIKGLKFLHSAQVIHRDLKPSNLLLNSDCHLRICDFGLARSLAVDKSDTKDAVLTEEVATRWYRAPEVLLGSNYYDKSADIWSVGCILAEILIGKPIFPGNSTLNQLERILSFTGKPKQQDIAALNSENALTMINEVNAKLKPLNQWFKPNISQDALDLLVSMLIINPKKRPTASQILKHPFLSSFHRPKQQAISSKIIHPPISDNTKLNLKEYRKLIYQRIKNLYNDQKQIQEIIPTTSIHNSNQHKKSIDRNLIKQSSKIIEKKNSITQEDQDIIINKNQKIQRPLSQNNSKKFVSVETTNNNLNQTRNTKANNCSFSSTKNVQGQRYSSTSNLKKGTSQGNMLQKYSNSSHYSSVHCANNYSLEDSEGVKKKNSLKDFLKTKKQVSVQSSYNICNPLTTMPKPQSRHHSYNPSQLLTPSAGNLMQYNYQNSSGSSQQKYHQSQSSQQYGNYPNQIYNQPYQTQSQTNHQQYNSSYINQGQSGNSSMKENKILY